MDNQTHSRRLSAIVLLAMLALTASPNAVAQERVKLSAGGFAALAADRQSPASALSSGPRNLS